MMQQLSKQLSSTLTRSYWEILKKKKKKEQSSLLL
jgi:hypothetical protein